MKQLERSRHELFASKDIHRYCRVDRQPSGDPDQPAHRRYLGWDERSYDKANEPFHRSVDLDGRSLSLSSCHGVAIGRESRMRSPSSSRSRLVLGVAGLFGVASLALILLATFPSLGEITRLDSVADIYRKAIRKQIFKIVLGTDIEPPWSHFAFDVATLWLSLFVVINVFVYRHEGVLLWGHIRRNYCADAVQAWHRAGLCTFSKWLVALAATPFACLRIFVESLRQTQHSLFSSCYITLDPTELGKYLKVLGVVIVAAFTIFAAAARWSLT